MKPGPRHARLFRRRASACERLGSSRPWECPRATGGPGPPGHSLPARRSRKARTSANGSGTSRCPCLDFGGPWEPRTYALRTRTAGRSPSSCKSPHRGASASLIRRPVTASSSNSSRQRAGTTRRNAASWSRVSARALPGAGSSPSSWSCSRTGAERHGRTGPSRAWLRGMNGFTPSRRLTGRAYRPSRSVLGSQPDRLRVLTRRPQRRDRLPMRDPRRRRQGSRARAPGLPR
jgi:hypothetical protein